jgi:acyl carrier protein
MEKLVAEVWQQTLGVERVGLDDNFFDLGGHSLLVARVRFALRSRLKRTIDMVDLFTFPTVRGFAQHLQSDKKEAASALDSQDRAARQKAAMLRRRGPEAGKGGLQ